MAGVANPKADKRLPRYLSQQELGRLFHSLERQVHPLALRNELIFKLLATTGMRRQELVDLVWEQIDLAAGTLLVHGKAKKNGCCPSMASSFRGRSPPERAGVCKPVRTCDRSVGPAPHF